VILLSFRRLTLSLALVSGTHDSFREWFCALMRDLSAQKKAEFALVAAGEALTCQAAAWGMPTRVSLKQTG